MKFKSPRDPNTPHNLVAIFIIPPGEPHPCSVGSGECTEPAIEAHDDTEGGLFYVCATHKPELEAFAKLVNEMTPKQFHEISAKIEAASQPK